jgi:hypothetical protein
MAGDHRVPKTVRMSLCGHFYADLVIFECWKYPIWLTAATWDFGKMSANSNKISYHFGMQTPSLGQD